MTPSVVGVVEAAGLLVRVGGPLGPVAAAAARVLLLERVGVGVDVFFAGDGVTGRAALRLVARGDLRLVLLLMGHDRRLRPDQGSQLTGDRTHRYISQVRCQKDSERVRRFLDLWPSCRNVGPRRGHGAVRASGFRPRMGRNPRRAYDAPLASLLRPKERLAAL